MKSFHFAAIVCVAGSAMTANAAVHTASNDPLNLFHGSVNQANVPVGPNNHGANSCVPTAVANSLTYLDSIGGFGLWYGGALIPTTTTAAAINMGTNFMGTHSENGTSFNGWIDGTVAYMQSVAPGKSQYAAMTGTYTSGAYAFPQIAFPTWQFLHAELNKGAAVTLAIVPLAAGIGHCISLVDFNFNDANNDNIVQNGELTLGIIDPSNPAALTNVTITGLNTGAMTLNFFNANYYIRGALSVVPTPAGAGLLAIGLLAASRRRR